MKMENLNNKRSLLFGFNIVGLSSEIRVGNEKLQKMEDIKKTFIEFEENMKIKYSRLILDSLEENLTSEEKQKQKRIFIDEILSRIRELHELGESEKIYKKDYRYFKQILLELLFKFFGHHKDIEFNFEYTVSALEDLKIIPKGAKDEIISLSPVGRWF
jgi:hypothetical protein